MELVRFIGTIWDLDDMYIYSPRIRKRLIQRNHWGVKERVVKNGRTLVYLRDFLTGGNPYLWVYEELLEKVTPTG